MVREITRKKNLFSLFNQKRGGKDMGHLMASNDGTCGQASIRSRTRNCVHPSPTLHLIDVQRFYGEILQFVID